MISAPPRFRPMLVAALLGFVAETLSLIRVAVPHTLVFDEVHYVPAARTMLALATRSEEHTSELQSLMRISYAVFCLKKKKYRTNNTIILNILINMYPPTYTCNL